MSKKASKRLKAHSFRWRKQDNKEYNHWALNCTILASKIKYGTKTT